MLKGLPLQTGRRPVIAEQATPNSRPPVVLPALTGVRGIAAWWVVIYHFREVIPPFDGSGGRGLLDRGYLAVDLFFVLSGFIIAMNYLSHFTCFSWRIYFRFLILRVGRIYPLHLFMLLAFLLNPITIVLLSKSHDPGARYDPAYFGMSLLLVQNWGFSDQLAWNVPAWSISTEWFAYLVFPFSALLAPLTSNRWRAIIGLVVCLLALNALTQMLDDEVPINGLPRCVLEFFAGTYVYVLWLHQGGAERCRSEYLVAAGLGLILVTSSSGVSEYAVAALAWCALIYGLANKRGPIPAMFSNRVVCAIGEYSYSTYLVHYFVRDWIKFLLVGEQVDWLAEMALYILATAVLSFALYRLIEVPGRSFVRRLVMRAGLRSPPGLPVARDL